MKVKKESEKAGLKLNIQKTKIMSLGSTTSRQIDQEKIEIATDFIFMGSIIIVDSDWNHEIKRGLLLGNKVYEKVVRCLKSRDITLLTNVCTVKYMVFLVLVYECDSGTIKKAECQIIDAFKLWCWRRLFKIPCAAQRSEQ